MGFETNTSSDPIALVRGDSVPPLESNEPAEPAEAGANTSTQEPRRDIVLAFSESLGANSLAAAEIAVELKRPLGDYEPVDVTVLAPQPGSHRLRIVLQDSMRLNGLYRVRASGITDASGSSAIPSSTSYFVVREGAYSQSEVLTFGETAFVGGVTLNEDLESYATFENNFVIGNPSVFFWTESISSARFGEPWLEPEIMYRGPSGSNQNLFQLNTGKLSFTREIAYFPWQEGNPNGSPNTGAHVVLKTPVTTVNPATGEFDFGATQLGQSSSGGVALPEGRMDMPEAAGAPLSQLHISFRGKFAARDDLLVSAWWSFTDPSGINTYQRARVYGNSIVPTVAWQPWGPSIELSSPGESLNSWPFLVQWPGGGAVALWWSNADENELRSGVAAHWWMAHCDASGIWSAGEIDEPLLPPGSLPQITDVKVVDAARIAVFARRPGVGPEVRVYDRLSDTWGLPSAPAGTFDIPLTYATAKINEAGASANYAGWRGFLYSTTPQAAPIGGTEFLVNWKTATNEQKFAIFRAGALGGAPSWSGVVDFADITPSTSVVNFAMSVDPIGWTTMTWREVDSGDGTSVVRAARANLITSGLAGLASAPALDLSDPAGAATFPGQTNLHSSGALGVVWNLGLPDPANPNNPPLLGTMFTRFH